MNATLLIAFGSPYTDGQMAAHRKLDRRGDDLCAGALRKRAWNTARSFFDSDRAAVL
jgi:hypothetical protein